MEPRVEPGHEPGLWRPQTLLCRGCLFFFLGKRFLDRARERKTQEWLEAKRPLRRARTCGSDAIARGGVSGLLEKFSVVIPVLSLHA